MFHQPQVRHLKKAFNNHSLEKMFMLIVRNQGGNSWIVPRLIFECNLDISNQFDLRMVIYRLSTVVSITPQLL